MTDITETGLFVLDGHSNPVPATREEWRRFRESGLQIVGRDIWRGRVEIVTEFLGADQDGDFPTAAEREKPPYLFGTAVIDARDPEGGEEPWFYQTWPEAADGHRRAVEHYRQLLGAEPNRPYSH